MNQTAAISIHNDLPFTGTNRAERDSVLVRTAATFLAMSIGVLYLYPVVEVFGHGMAYSLPHLASVFLVASGIVLLGFAALLSLSDAFRPYPWCAKTTWSMLVLWCSAVILMSVSTDLRATWQLFNRVDGAGPWVIPMIMLLGGQMATWRRLNTLFIVHTAFAVFFAGLVVLFFRSEASSFRPSEFFKFGLLYAGGFLFLTWSYQRKFARLVGLAGTLAYGFIAFVASWRHGLVTCLYLVLAFMLIRQMQTKGLLNKMLTVYLYLFGMMLLAVVLMVAVNSSDYLTMRTERFQRKFGQDSRSAVIKEFLAYENRNPNLLITGSGALGTYTSVLFTDRNISKRENIENGYLQIVHKGGLIMLVLFLAVTVPASLLGLFGSSNWFTRITGVLVFGRLTDMVLYGIPWTDPSYVLFWLCVGACLNPRLRRLRDADISIRRPVLRTAAVPS